MVSFLSRKLHFLCLKAFDARFVYDKVTKFKFCFNKSLSIGVLYRKVDLGFDFFLVKLVVSENTSFV